MQHRPVSEDAVRHMSRYQRPDPEMSVIATDTLERRLDVRLGTLEQSQIDVLSADQRSGYSVPRVAFSCIEQVAAENGGVISEML